MTTVRQVGSEQGRLTRDMARQIEDELSATNQMVSARKDKAKSRKAQGGSAKAR